MVLSTWNLTEYLGIAWEAQVVSRVVDGLDIPDGTPLRVRDDAGCMCAAQRVGNRLFYIADLPAHAHRRFELEVGEADASPLRVGMDDGVLELANRDFGIRIVWVGDRVVYDPPCTLASCPPPVAQVRGVDGVWFGHGAWDSDLRCHGFWCERVFEGPVAVFVRQVYELDAGAISFTYRLDAMSPFVRVDVTGACEGVFASWVFDDFEGTHAFWRAHSTDDWRGPKAAGNWHRQVYAIRRSDPPDDQFLQPFYNWNRNGAMFWSCWADRVDRRDLLLIGAVRPSETRCVGRFRPHRIRNGARLDMSVPNGRTSLVIGMLDRTDALPESGRPGSAVEGMYRRMHGLDLDACARMDPDWAGIEGIRFPRLFIGAKDLAGVRRGARDWAWFRNAFDAHVDDRLFFSNAQPDLKARASERMLGRDLAGAYLASGARGFAREAFEDLNAQLNRWVGELGALGPTVDPLIGFAFAGPFRAAVIAFDLIAAALSDEDRAVCLRKIAFLTAVFFSKDAWPDPTSGLSRGNLNFHASVVSARGLAAALLEGHPKQRDWLVQTCREAADFLRAYHFESGVAREAITYQFNAVAQFTLLSMALRRAGADDLFETEPMLKRSFDFLASVQTPRDPRVGFCMLPTVGHVTSYGWGQSLQACFAWAAKATAESDPAFSARMTAAWQRAGSPVVSLHDFYHGQIWWPPLCLVDRSLEGEVAVGKSGLHDGFGAVFRSVETDGYLLVKMGRSRGHYDPDEGALLWYAWGVPVLADFGCQYNPNIECAWLHNRLSFDRWNEMGDHAFEVKSAHCGRVDAVRGAMTVRRLHRWAERPIRDAAFDFRALPGPRDIAPVTWERDVVYVKDCEAIVLRDAISGEQATDWNLQVFAEAVRVDGARAHFRGAFGVDLDVFVAAPGKVSFEVGSFEHFGFDEPRLPAWWWRGAEWTAPEGVVYGPVGERALHLYMPGAIRTDYLVLLLARPSERAVADVTVLADGFVWETNGGRWTVRFREGCWECVREGGWEEVVLE